MVDELIDDHIVEKLKEKENIRDNKLYLKYDNMLVSVSLQLEAIETAFKDLLAKSKEHWGQLQDTIKKEWERSEFDLFIDSLVGNIPESSLYFRPTTILRLIIISISTHSTNICIGKLLVQIFIDFISCSYF